jgi:hypothetical protein
MKDIKDCTVAELAILLAEHEAREYECKCEEDTTECKKHAQGMEHN